MDLETTYYVIGIIFMSLMLLLMVISVIVILVIRAKINKIHRQIEEKLEIVNLWANTAKNISSEVTDTVKKAKKVVTGH